MVDYGGLPCLPPCALGVYALPMASFFFPLWLFLIGLGAVLQAAALLLPVRRLAPFARLGLVSFGALGVLAGCLMQSDHLGAASQVFFWLWAVRYAKGKVL